MNDIQLHTNKYLDYCSHQKWLDKKTIKAYHIDLDQFVSYISELCSLNVNDVNLQGGTILIYGKGSKERRLQLDNKDVITTLEN